MSTPTDSHPAYGRRVVDQARRLDRHPNTLIRHIRTGVLLRDGSRIRLQATVTPGGYRISDADIDVFYGALTRDRLGTPAPSVRSPGQTSRDHDRADAALAEAGF
jgi:hypothetical protein